jgi:hypothetical protein
VDYNCYLKWVLWGQNIPPILFHYVTSFINHKNRESHLPSTPTLTCWSAQTCPDPSTQGPIQPVPAFTDPSPSPCTYEHNSGFWLHSLEWLWLVCMWPCISWWPAPTLDRESHLPSTPTLTCWSAQTYPDPSTQGPIQPVPAFADPSPSPCTYEHNSGFWLHSLEWPWLVCMWPCISWWPAPTLAWGMKLKTLFEFLCQTAWGA